MNMLINSYKIITHDVKLKETNSFLTLILKLMIECNDNTYILQSEDIYVNTNKIDYNKIKDEISQDIQKLGNKEFLNILNELLYCINNNLYNNIGGVIYIGDK